MWLDDEDNNDNDKKSDTKPDEGGPAVGQYDENGLPVPDGSHSLDSTQL